MTSLYNFTTIPTFPIFFLFDAEREKILNQDFFIIIIIVAFLLDVLFC